MFIYNKVNDYDYKVWFIFNKLLNVIIEIILYFYFVKFFIFKSEQIFTWLNNKLEYEFMIKKALYLFLDY